MARENKKEIIYFLFLLIFGSTACEESEMHQYNSLVKKELENNKKVNDIFFGISLGMTSKEFYTHCWSLNKKGMFTDGPGNASVAYKLVKNELRHPAEMNFYPGFHNDRIHNMWVKFQYSGWAPWNKHLESDELLDDVLILYKKWYPGGNPFITIKDEKKGTIYVKVDGNRRIIIGRYDDVYVKADYTDLSVKQNVK
jgi:hypothetical protein